MTTRRRPLARFMIAAAALITAAIVQPPRARAQDSGAPVGATAAEAAGGGGGWCSRIPPGYAHPPASIIPLTVQLVQASVEPVPATDGLIHLAYTAQVINTQATPYDVAGVVPVDPLAGFAPTGRNHVADDEGRDLTGMVRLFDTSGAGTLPEDGPPADSAPGFSTRVPAGNAGVMFFDVTYTDPARIPRLLAHAITLAPAGGGAGTPSLTDPVPVGCRPLAVLHPPLAGHGWFDANGCCAFIDAHRGAILAVNGVLQASEQFAVDYIQLGPNGTCCNGPPATLSAWWGYGAPVLAAAAGTVVAVVDGLPDQLPVGTKTGVTAANAAGNSVIEDIGGGRYIGYAHFVPGSIPSSVRAGARLRPGDLIGRLGNSGNSDAPHLHFQVMDSPSFLDATGLPFVFDSQVVEGTVIPGGNIVSGGPVTIDRTGAGLQRNRMPLKPQVFGYNLSPSE